MVEGIGASRRSRSVLHRCTVRRAQRVGIAAAAAPSLPDQLDPGGQQSAARRGRQADLGRGPTRASRRGRFRVRIQLQHAGARTRLRMRELLRHPPGPERVRVGAVRQPPDPLTGKLEPGRAVHLGPWSVTPQACGANSTTLPDLIMYDRAVGPVVGAGDVGKASISLTVGYLLRASAPARTVAFGLGSAHLKFRSAKTDWLVVSGPRTVLQGSGTVNGRAATTPGSRRRTTRTPSASRSGRRPADR